MLAKCASTKPLYKFQRNLDYVKHKQKLKQIIKKSPKSPTTRPGKSLQIRPWVKQKLRNELQKTHKAIETENQKLLHKLMKISTRNSLQLQASDGVRHRENPYRQNWLKEIKRENQEFGEKLIHLRSSLEYSRFTKSIDQYEKVKKSMKMNRRARLPLLSIKPTGLDYLKKVLKTQPDQTLNNLQTLRNLQNQQCQDTPQNPPTQKQKDQPTI